MIPQLLGTTQTNGQLSVAISAVVQDGVNYLKLACATKNQLTQSFLPTVTYQTSDGADYPNQTPAAPTPVSGTPPAGFAGAADVLIPTGNVAPIKVLSLSVNEGPEGVETSFP